MLERRAAVREAGTETRERLLDAAERLFAEEGIAATSLRAITLAAGVNVAAIHYHFGSKEALLEAVFTRRLAPVNAERLLRLARLEGEPGGARVEASPGRAAGADGVGGASCGSGVDGTSRGSGADGTSRASRVGGTSRGSGDDGTSRASGDDGATRASEGNGASRGSEDDGASRGSEGNGASRGSYGAGASAAASAGPSVERILEALLAPVVRLLRDPAGARLAVLFGRLYVEPEEIVVKLLRDQFGDVSERFATALGRALPELSEPEVRWRLHCAVGAMGHLLSSRRLPELAREFGVPDDGEDATLRRLIGFCAAGFRAPVREEPS